MMLCISTQGSATKRADNWICYIEDTLTHLYGLYLKEMRQQFINGDVFMTILALGEDILIINQSYSSAINNKGLERCSGRYQECKYLVVIVINERGV